MEYHINIKFKILFYYIMTFLTLDIGGSGIKIIEFNDKKDIIQSYNINCIDKDDEEKRIKEFYNIENVAFSYIKIFFPLSQNKKIFVSNCGLFNSENGIVSRWGYQYKLLSELSEEGYQCKVVNDGIAHAYSILYNTIIDGPILSLTFGTGIGYSAFNIDNKLFIPCDTDDIILDHRIDDDYPDKNPHQLLGHKEMMELWMNNKFYIWEKRFNRLLDSLFANIQPKTLLLFGGITQREYKKGNHIFNKNIIPLIKSTYYCKNKGISIKIGGKYSGNIGSLNYFSE